LSEIQQMQTQTSYAETFPLDGVPHGFYSSMMNTLGNICGNYLKYFNKFEAYLGTRVLQDCIESCEAIAFEIKEINDEPGIK
ncbi:139_t:CDS:2, partial [Gigaspora rosea]